MRLRVFLALIQTLIGYPSLLHAQTEGEGLYDYQKEYIGGLNFNTNAGIIGGFMFRHAKAFTPSMLKFMTLELVNVRGLKEVRTASNQTNNFFTVGKQNYLFVLRGQYGLERILFSKGKEDGVQVDMLVGLGPSIGIIKPYFIEYDYVNFTAVESYNPQIHDFNRILGNGGFFTGLGKSKFTAGINMKLALSFEFGHFESNVSGIEAGFLIEAFPKKIPIMVSPLPSFPSHNRSVFTALFVNIFYGTRR